MQLRDIDSFLTYASDQGHESNGYIYADPDARTLTAVFNDQKHVDYPGWRDFRAVYTAELSRELGIWLKHNKNPMEQEEFAVFLEDIRLKRSPSPNLRDALAALRVVQHLYEESGHAHHP